MDIETFEDLVDRLGEDVSAWPSPAREAGTALIATSAQAREIVADAARLRQELSRHTPLRAPAGLADRIMAQVATPRAEMPASEAPLVPAEDGVAAAAPGWRRRALERLSPSVVLPLCFLVGLSLSLLPPGNRSGDTALVGPSVLSDLLQ